jgi:poly(hydroxyalkanoate) depolymerase family esterase
MNETFRALMREATALTRGGRLKEAVAAIQRALPAVVARSPVPSASPAAPVAPCPIAAPASPVRPSESPRFVREATVPNAAPPQPQAGGVEWGSQAEGGRDMRYRLYVPPGPLDAARPLIVMLHGCTQDPDDFAAGTGMDELARARGLFVLYPQQTARANPQRCWNWFKHNHQRRGSGEPALIAAAVRAVLLRHRADPQRVFVAGLSAGGAMADIVGAAYPDLFAAVGVHSGLPRGAAGSVGEALAAMGGREGSAGPTSKPSGQQPLPTIVFHGDRDATVHPVNGERIVAALLAGTATGTTTVVETGRAAGGLAFTCTLHRGSDGASVAEHWLVQGGGHAWSGGRAQGSFTDARGPDASAEMLRFFLAHPKAAPTA